jgi:RNA polymerase sigma factor (sigma-70 family)
MGGDAQKDILNRESIAELYEQHAKDLVVYARSIVNNLDDAQELVHDLFCSLYDKVSDKKITTKSIRSFLFVSVKNKALNLLKKNKKESELSDYQAFTTGMTDSVDDSIALNEVYSFISSSFTPAKREIFSLRIVYDLTWKEIAEITGKAVSSVHYEFNEMVLTISRRFPDAL